MLCIVHCFRKGEGAVPVSEIRSRLSLPTRIVNDVLYQLVEAGMLIEVNNQDDDRETAFSPGRDIHGMTFYNILRAVDRKGTTHLHLAGTAEMRQIEQSLKELRSTIRSEGERIRLIDLDDSLNRQNQAGETDNTTGKI